MAALKAALLSGLLSLALGCSSVNDKIEAALADGDHDLAVQLLWSAAVDSQCPQRGRFLLHRAEVQQLVARDVEAMHSIEKAVSACPELLEAFWARAQQHASAGNRQEAIADAKTAAPLIVEAAELQRRLEIELEQEATVRRNAQRLVESLREVLDPKAGEVPLADRSPALLARQVPLPIRLKYEVVQDVSSPLSFRMGWVESLSYRGDATASSYTLVRALELPPLDRSLPLYYRLLMSNQRLPMRFRVSSHGEVLSAEWHRDGPNRGMRPEMLRPEIEGMLKRRRLFDPGNGGARSPGESWNGEDVRIVDGKPVAVRYSSTAAGWVAFHGVRTLHIKSRLNGEGYTGTEETWVHPGTSVVVQWLRRVAYEVTSDKAIEPWEEETVGTLVSIHGPH